MQTIVIFTALVAAASASWNGAPAWGGPAGWNGGPSGWAGAPAQVVVQNGQVQDTPEVVAEKAKHFALVSEAAARAAASGPDHGQWNNGNNGPWNGNNAAWNGDNGNGAWNNADNGAWNGDNGAWNGDNGAWNQGPAPAAAWNAGPAQWAGHGAWNGGAAKIVVNNGQVQETPEVAAARAQHLAALQQAAAQSGPAHGQQWG